MHLLAPARVKPGFVALVVMVALWLALAPPSGLQPEQARILGIVLVTLSLWATSVVPGYLASLIFFSTVLVLDLAPPETVFAGFGSAAIWLIVSGFVIGAAIAASGLGDLLARKVGPLLTGSYPRLIGGLMLTAMVLGFLIPSSVGRAVVLMPLGMALAEKVGFGPGSPGRIGIAAVLAIGCNVPSFAILPANIPNVIMLGAAESIHGVSFGYMEYLWLHYPVLGVLKAALTVWLVLRFFPAQIAPMPAPVPTSAPASGKPVARRVQIRVMAVLLATLALWMTDSLHGINAAWVGLVAASVLLLPKIGVVTPPMFKASVDFGILLFVAGALALGALVNASGLGGLFGGWLESVLPLAPGADFVNFLSLSGMAVVTGVFTTIPGVPAVLTPMAPELAQQTGFAIETVLMTQVIGFSTVIFPYQVGPLILAMQLSGEKLGHLMRVTIGLSFVTLILLVPLDYLWWRLLGWF